MREMLKESLIVTVYMISVFGIGIGLFFLVGLIAEVGSIILTVLSAVIVMFVFVFSLLAILRFTDRFE